MTDTFTIDSIRRRLASREILVGQAARETGWPLSRENFLIPDAHYIIEDDAGKILDRIDAANPVEALEKFQSSFHEENTTLKTYYRKTHAYLPAINGCGEWKKINKHFVYIPVHPTEPPCSEKAHEWFAPVELVGQCELYDTPGVWGEWNIHVFEVCMHCGCERHIYHKKVRASSYGLSRYIEPSSYAVKFFEYSPGKYRKEVEDIRKNPDFPQALQRYKEDDPLKRYR